MKTVLFIIFVLLQVSSTDGVDSWPVGKYGLPKVNNLKTGCPVDTWVEGWRLQDLDKKSDTSYNIHMKVLLDGSGSIKRTFCMKNVVGTGTAEWPSGFYCIYKCGPCPKGMIPGSVQWDDRDPWFTTSKNADGGTIPDGVYNDLNTNISYCCQNKGKWSDPIELPTHRPFYLLPHNSSTDPARCQIVKWTMSWLEYIDYDTEETGLTGKSIDKGDGSHVFFERTDTGMRVRYCYYEDCRHKMSKNEGEFSTSNDNPQFDKCSWSIEVEKSRLVSITFIDLQLPKCQEGYLAMYDGGDESTPLLEKYCDSKTQKNPIVSSGNKVFVTIKSLERMGIQLKFHAKYIAQVPATPSTAPTRRTSTRTSRSSTKGFPPSTRPNSIPRRPTIFDQDHQVPGFISNTGPTREPREQDTTSKNKSSTSFNLSYSIIYVAALIVLFISF